MTEMQGMRAMRLREKLATTGAKQLSDAELLAVFISCGSGKKSCLQLAQELIHRFGDLRAVLNANLKAFTQIRGLGSVRFLQLQAAREICERSHFIHLKTQQQLTNSEETYLFIKRQLRDKKNETFAALFLDSQHRIIQYEELFFGTINTANVYARPLIERALTLNAAALIIAHNHPSGVANPSRHDCQLTQHLQKALKLVDVQLLDHLVIGDNEVFSIMSQLKFSCH